MRSVFEAVARAKHKAAQRVELWSAGTCISVVDMPHLQGSPLQNPDRRKIDEICFEMPRPPSSTPDPRQIGHRSSPRRQHIALLKRSGASAVPPLCALSGRQLRSRSPEIGRGRVDLSPFFPWAQGRAKRSARAGRGARAPRSLSHSERLADLQGRVLALRAPRATRPQHLRHLVPAMAVGRGHPKYVRMSEHTAKRYHGKQHRPRERCGTLETDSFWTWERHACMTDDG